MSEEQKMTTPVGERWEDAPEWARFKARDANGDVFWYENNPQPKYNTLEWMNSAKGGRIQLATPGIAWDETLEERPTK